MRTALDYTCQGIKPKAWSRQRKEDREGPVGQHNRAGSLFSRESSTTAYSVEWETFQLGTGNEKELEVHIQSHSYDQRLMTSLES